MAVVIETTLGDITVDLYLEQRPVTCLNFLKLCKQKYYNFNLFHTIRNGFIAQTGDPSGVGSGGESIFGLLEGPEKRFFSGERMPKIRHTNAGLISMVCTEDMMVGSQFFFTLAPDLDSLDGVHCVIGEVTEGHDVLRKLNEVICDETHRPYQDVRITHTVILEDPYNDPPGFRAPSRSPSPSAERLKGGRIAPDEELDETQGKTAEEIQEIIEEKEAKARATILEIVGDLPDADIAPPENVLFVCKLNPVTTDEDLEIIFSRFGKIVSCEVIRDKKSGDSLQYAFIEFSDKKSCEDAYFKMDNVLIDDRRIHVDFSQSVSKMRWLGKGRGVQHFDDADAKDNQVRNKTKQPYNNHESERDRNSNRHKHEKDVAYNNQQKNEKYGSNREEKYDKKKHSEHERKKNKGRSRTRSLDRSRKTHNRDRSHDRSSQKNNDNVRQSDKSHRNSDSSKQFNRSHKNSDHSKQSDRSHKNSDHSKQSDRSQKNSDNYKQTDRSHKSSDNSKEYERSHKNSDNPKEYDRSQRSSANSKQSDRSQESQSKTHKHDHERQKEKEERSSSHRNRSPSKDTVTNEQKNHEVQDKYEEKSIKLSEKEHSYNEKEQEKKQDRNLNNVKKRKRSNSIDEEQKEHNEKRIDYSDREINNKRLRKSIENQTDVRTPSPAVKNASKVDKNKKSSNKSIKIKKKVVNSKKKKRKPSTSSSDSDSSESSSSSSESSSSSGSDRRRRRRKKRKYSTSSSDSSDSTSSSSSSDSSSESSSSSSDSGRDRRKSKKNKKKIVKKSRKK